MSEEEVRFHSALFWAVIGVATVTFVVLALCGCLPGGPR